MGRANKLGVVNDDAPAIMSRLLGHPNFLEMLPVLEMMGEATPNNGKNVYWVRYLLEGLTNGGHLPLLFEALEEEPDNLKALITRKDVLEAFLKDQEAIEKLGAELVQDEEALDWLLGVEKLPEAIKPFLEFTEEETLTQFVRNYHAHGLTTKYFIIDLLLQGVAFLHRR